MKSNIFGQNIRISAVAFIRHVLFLVAIGGWGQSIQGEIISLANAAVGTVQKAIDDAVDGDVIMLPSGTVTWDTPIIIRKGITLRGAGQNATIIVDAIPKANTALIQMYDLGRRFARVCHFTINSGPTSSADGLIRVGRPYVGGSGIVNTNTSWRIDHITFNLLKRGITTKGRSYGVIDNCVFNADVAANQQGVAVWGDNELAWDRPLTLGTLEAVYIEDCLFSWTKHIADSALDSYGGGKFVFRYNTMINIEVGCHGLDSGSYRSPVSWEVYGNKYYDGYGIHAPRAIGEFRGGTGMIFSNMVYRTTKYAPKTLIDVRYGRASFGDAINVGNALDGLPPFQFVAGRRTVTDAILTKGSNILISEQAQFSYYRDYGICIEGQGIAPGTKNNTTNLNGQTTTVIFQNQSRTRITMSKPATETIVGATVTFYNPWDNLTTSAPAGAAPPYDKPGSSYGYPALDQIGAAPPTFPRNLHTTAAAPTTHTSQGHQAAYQWANYVVQLPPAPAATILMQWGIWNGYRSDTDNQVENHPNTDDIIQRNRDVVDWTPSGGGNYPQLEAGGFYKPLEYPHPFTKDARPSAPLNLVVVPNP
jgi:hypothetical protein